MPLDPRSLRHEFARWSDEQKASRTPFAPVYKPHADQLLQHKSLSRTAKLTYLWLLIHNSRKTGEERWTVAQIAEGIALKERAVQTALAELEAERWIYRHQFGANKAVNYFIVPPDLIGQTDQIESTPEEEETSDDH